MSKLSKAQRIAGLLSPNQRADVLASRRAALRSRGAERAALTKTPAQLQSEIAKTLHQKQTRVASQRYYPAYTPSDVWLAWAATMRPKKRP